MLLQNPDTVFLVPGRRKKRIKSLHYTEYITTNIELCSLPWNKTNKRQGNGAQMGHLKLYDRGEITGKGDDGFDRMYNKE